MNSGSGLGPLTGSFWVRFFVVPVPTANGAGPAPLVLFFFCLDGFSFVGAKSFVGGAASGALLFSTDLHSGSAWGHPSMAPCVNRRCTSDKVPEQPIPHFGGVEVVAGRVQAQRCKMDENPCADGGGGRWETNLSSCFVPSPSFRRRLGSNGQEFLMEWCVSTLLQWA